MNIDKKVNTNYLRAFLLLFLFSIIFSIVVYYLLGLKIAITIFNIVLFLLAITGISETQKQINILRDENYLNNKIIQKLKNSLTELESGNKPTLSPMEDIVPQKSAKLLNALRSRTKLTSKEIELLTEREGWDIIYSLSNSNKKPLEEKPAICFTGFTNDEKDLLVEIAIAHNFHVTQKVIKSLSLLVCGDEPGTVKLETAKEQQTTIITKKEFLDLIESGDYINVKPIKP